MSIKNSILKLPLSDKRKEALGRIYHRIHDPALNIYLSIVALARKAKWICKTKKKDIYEISAYKPIEELIPIHIAAWHHGSAYYRVKIDGNYYFVKKESNQDIAKREIAFYKLIDGTDNISIKQHFPKLYFFKHSHDASYIISSYLDIESGKNIIAKLKVSDQNRILKQLMDIMRWMRFVGVCHNDLRMDNICIQKNKVVLFDFGYSCMYSNRQIFLSELSNEELEKLNKHNRIGKFISDDAFSMYNIMKEISPDFMSSNKTLWTEINSYIGEYVLQRRM